MAKEMKNFAAAPNTGNDVDLTTQAQVENVAEQGSSGTPLPEETVSRNEMAHNVTHDDLATATTTESDTAPRDGENMSAGQDEQAQATPDAGPEDPKANAYKLVSIEDQQSRDKLKDYLSAKGVEAQVVLKYDLRELMAAAIILVAYAANRKVDEKHVNKLLQSLKKSGKKRFSEPITVCSAKTALKLGVKLVDDEGNEITLSHPDIDRMLVVLDGQHRRSGVLSDPEYDADVIIIETPEDINEYVRVINAYDSNWTMDDLRNQNEVTTGVEDKLKAKEKEAEAILPNTSPKFRNCGLCGGVKEAVRKKDLLDGKIPSYDEDKANIGIEIFKSIRLLNPDCTKNEMLTMSMLEVIFKAKEHYNDKVGSTTDFIKHFKLFMNEERNKGLDPKKKDKVSAFILDFTKNFKAFVKQNPLTPDTDEQIKVIDEHIQSIIDAGVASTGKVYARGSMSDVVAKMKERKENQKKLEAEKQKMDDAINAAKDAYRNFKKTL